MRFARALCLAALLTAPAALAQDKPPAPGLPPAPSLPPVMTDITTHHTLDLPGRSLSFTATVGAIRLLDAKDVPDAEVGVTAYTLDGADPATRPVTFVVNGGPGAGSAWMQLGALGPWRIKLDRPSPSMPVALVPNAETWLDFTDLVLLDPPGTGFARIRVGLRFLRFLFQNHGITFALHIENDLRRVGAIRRLFPFN